MIIKDVLLINYQDSFSSFVVVHLRWTLQSQFTLSKSAFSMVVGSSEPASRVSTRPLGVRSVSNLITDNCLGLICESQEVQLNPQAPRSPLTNSITLNPLAPSWRSTPTFWLMSSIWPPEILPGEGLFESRTFDWEPSNLSFRVKGCLLWLESPLVGFNWCD